MSREMSEIEVLESEIERLETEYYVVFDERNLLIIDDENFDGKLQWFNEELDSLETEIQYLREELSWVAR